MSDGFEKYQQSLDNHIKYKQKSDRQHRIHICVLYVVLLCLLVLVWLGYSKNSVQPTAITPVDCPTLPPQKKTPPPEDFPPPVFEPKGDGKITDDVGNQLAKVTVYTISNQYQWKLKNSQEIENISQASVSIPLNSIVDANLITQLKQSDAIIAVGTASEEGADKNPEAQSELATQRTRSLANYIIKNIQNQPKPIFTLDLGFFDAKDKSIAPQIQRSVIILGVTKIDKNFNLETEEGEVLFKEGLADMFAKDKTLLPDGLEIRDYRGYFDLNKVP